MDQTKKANLEASGWAVDDYVEFLKLTPQEVNCVDMQAHKEKLDEDYLTFLDSLNTAATASPWYPRSGDDSHCMNARWVSTEQSDKFCYLYDEPSTSVIAITLLQQPRLADIPDDYDANMSLICEYRSAVPLLINEIRRLREELEKSKR